MVIDAVAAELGVRLRRPVLRRYQLRRARARNGARLVLVKPQTYMNRSGEVLPAVLRRAGVSSESLVIVCDQLDLPPGIVRIKRGGSDAGHRGLKSVASCLADERFIRVYIGVGKPPARDQVVEHVLSVPEDQELECFREGVVLGAAAVLRLCESPLEEVMNEFNQRGSRF